MSLRRSALYVPASNGRAIAKARALACDVVILDLEDAVAPEAKEQARVAAFHAVVQGFGDKEVVVRVNTLDSQWGPADLVAVATSGAAAVLVPKITGPSDIARYDHALAGVTRDIGLWAMIETCRSVLHLGEIAAASAQGRLSGLVMGTNDLASEMRSTSGVDRAPLQAALSLTVTAARAHGLTVLDGVCNALDDVSRFEAECAQGRALGFDGKTLIHPDQIAPCNAAFSPTPAELAFAAAVIAAFARPENAGRGALRVEGRMVEPLHLRQAEQLVAAAKAVALS